jgi:hypothetical protein
MGQSLSQNVVANTGVNTTNNKPRQIATLETQRTPVLDGASGLHYSGRIYTNQFSATSADICKGTVGTVSFDKVGEVMPQSISTPTLPVDESTKRISRSALIGYIQNLQNTGLIPGKMKKVEDQLKADTQFYAAVQAEYCFYESRYRAALTQVLTLIADPNGANESAVSGALTTTININKRLNSLLEILNYVGNERAKAVNDRSSDIHKANDDIQQKIAVLKSQKEFLQTSDVRIRTQEEMMRFSSEKSRAMNIQIMFFVALNVVALGTIVTVYKSVRPSV